MRRIIKTTLLATFLTTVPTEGKIKQFLSFGMAFVEGYDMINWQKKNDSTDCANIVDVEDIVNQVAIALSCQLEHEFGPNLIYGLNTRLILGSPLYTMNHKFYGFVTIGGFFGGQICQSKNVSCYMKFGVNYVLGKLFDTISSGQRFNPYLEFSIRQPRCIHNIELGGLIGKTGISSDLYIYDKPTVA